MGSRLDFGKEAKKVLDEKETYIDWELNIAFRNYIITSKIIFHTKVFFIIIIIILIIYESAMLHGQFV